jgi:hypothetical protein
MLEVPVTPYQKLRISNISLTSIDPDDPENRWAIYILHNLVARAKDDIVIGNLAHETTHFYHRIKGLDAITPEEIRDTALGKISLVQSHLLKEREIMNAEDLFTEPVRAALGRMEDEKRGSTGAEYFTGATAVDTDQFFTQVLGGKDNAQRFLEKRYERMKQRLQ